MLLWSRTCDVHGPASATVASRLLITGFGAFGEFESNPSAALAGQASSAARILPVSFNAVDAFIEEVTGENWDALLMLGVAGGSTAMRTELVARNHIGPTADVEGCRMGPAAIDPKGPMHLRGTLWSVIDVWRFEGAVEESVDAGDYLCNYAYFRALQKLHRTRVGFLHVAPTNRLPIETQSDILNRIVSAITSTAD